MSNLHHISARFRESTSPAGLRAPSADLDNLIKLESEEGERKPSIVGEEEDVKPMSYHSASQPWYTDGPNETLRIPPTRDATFYQLVMPKLLAQRLCAEERPGVELGKMRVYAAGTPQERSFLVFPRQDGSGKDDIYELSAQETGTSHELVVAMQPAAQATARERKAPSSTSFTPTRKHESESDEHLLSLEDDGPEHEGAPVYHTRLSGPIIAHLHAKATSVAVSGRPMNPEPVPKSKLLKKRTLAVPPSMLRHSMLGLPAGKHTLVMPTGPSATAKSGPKDKRTRTPRNVLLDMLFEAFKEQSQMSMRTLLDVTNQPARYLKEVLAVVAVCKNNIWMLKDEFAHQRTRAAAVGNLPTPSNDVDEEEDDDDMEEVV
ncbi:unnamed protein product [Peniophora sp. CBMAI 1063]|nr:unnamed protein product [Peniophora sp. CBMAI 1063]